METLDFPVEAAPAPADNATATISADSRFSGVTVRQLDPALSESKNLPYDATGVLITAIAPNSPAEAMGLQVDDVILQLNDTDIKDAQTFSSTASQRVRTWQIILQRDGRVSRAIVSG